MAAALSRDRRKKDGPNKEQQLGSMPRRERAPPVIAPCTKAEACGYDEDVCCQMDNLKVDQVLPAACTSLQCLARDLGAAKDLRDVQTAISKHDRHVYLLVALTILVLGVCILFPRRRTPPPPAYLTRGPWPGGAGCICGRG